MVLAMDLDVLADDYLVRFIVDFEDDDTQKSFVEKQQTHKWFETTNVHNHTRIIGPHDIDHVIIAIEGTIRSLQDKTTSEIYHLAHTTHHPFFTMTTIPLEY